MQLLNNKKACWELLDAARVGDIRKAKYLLKFTPLREFFGQVANPNAEENRHDKPSHSTPLINTLRGDYESFSKLELLRLLIEKGARIRPSDLIEACNLGDIDAINLFIANGADVNAQENFTTPIITAVKANHKEVVELLLDAGANPNRLIVVEFVAYDRGRRAATSIVSSSPPISRNQFEILQLLVNRGAEMDLDLLTACWHGHINAVQLFIEMGADLNFSSSTDSGPHTPLSEAAEKGQVEIVKLLLDNGADARAHDSFALKRVRRWQRHYSRVGVSEGNQIQNRLAETWGLLWDAGADEDPGWSLS